MHDFIEFLYITTNFNLFATLTAILLCISIIALFLIKRFMPLHFRYQENEVIGYTSAMIIVIYGVLAGLATLYLIDNIDHASQAVQSESNGLANLYRESLVLSDPLKSLVQKDIKNYVTEVLKVEWPLMAKDKTVSSHGDQYIEHLTQLLTQNKLGSPGETTIVQNMLLQTSNLYDARQERIQDSYASLNSAIWVVIIIGTILTLLVSYIFGVHFYLHIFIVTAAVLMTSSVIFLMISLDKPFMGDASVGPEPIQNVLLIMNGKTTLENVAQNTR